MSTPVGVIGGSGAGEMEPFRTWEPFTAQTRFGPAQIRRGDVDGRPVIFAARHGRGHAAPPHMVNYRALICALVELGAERIIGTSAVGSLSLALRPGTAAVLTDFIDFTRRGPITFFDGAAPGVVHTDFSQPYCPEVCAALARAVEQAGLEVTTPCVYLCTDGPRYETPAEIRMLGSWGADVVGMTNAPEAILAREVGACYGAIAVVTNYASGISPTPLSHDEVLAVMKSVEARLAAALLQTIRTIPSSRECTCGTRTSP